MNNKLVLVFALFSIFVIDAIAQDQPNKKLKVKKGYQVILRDTAFVAKRDTTITLTPRQAKTVRIRRNPSDIATMFYDSLEHRASGGRVSKDIFAMVVKKKGNKERLVNATIVSESVFKPFEGTKIGSVVIKVVDVLEGSVIDTLQKATTKIGIFVNKVHKDTRINIIRQNLLFKAGDTIDAYRMADNERLLRLFKPLRDARIYLNRDKKNKNVVHVVVVVQDVASVGFTGARNTWQDFRLDVFHVNLAGTGSRLQLSYFRNENYEPHNGYEVILQHPNLWGTFLQGQVQYADNFIHKRAGFSVGRDFFTPEVKYAGGVGYYHARENFYVEEYDTLDLPHTENNFEAWAGRSFEIRKRTNLIFSALVNSRKFYETSFVSSDSNVFFHDRTMVLGSVALAKRNYFKSLRIRGFGRTEDIPVGESVALIAGPEKNEFGDRFFVQGNVTVARYFPKVGYLNASASLGTFLRKGTSQDGVFSLSATAFSDLIRLKRTQMRQFVFFGLTQGLNRIIDRTLELEGRWRDDVGHKPIGNRRVNIGLETDYFMPWYFYGFQFTLFYRGDIYLLARNSNLVDTRSLFYSVRAGVRSLNENLVLPAFSIDLTFYGKNENFPAAWQFRFTTTLPDLFITNLSFKPQTAPFD